MKAATAASHELGRTRLKKASGLVAELGAIEKLIAKAYAQMAAVLGTRPERAAQLRAEILALYEDAQAEIPFVAEGGGFVGTLSARANETTTDTVKVYKALGRDKFIALASIRLGVLRKELDGPAQAECLTTTRTGPRTLSVIEKAA